MKVVDESCYGFDLVHCVVGKNGSENELLKRKFM